MALKEDVKCRRYLVKPQSASKIISNTLIVWVFIFVKNKLWHLESIRYCCWCHREFGGVIFLNLPLVGINAGFLRLFFKSDEDRTPSNRRQHTRWNLLVLFISNLAVSYLSGTKRVFVVKHLTGYWNVRCDSPCYCLVSLFWTKLF